MKEAEEINVIRNKYIQAGLDQEKIPVFLEYMQNHNSEFTPFIDAYFGSALLMQAGLAKENLVKFKTFTSGREKLEQAVKQDIDNPEFRYLRFMVQCNAPKFLNYNNILEDKIVIIKYIDKLLLIDNSFFVSNMLKSLINSSLFTLTERAIFQNFLKKYK